MPTLADYVASYTRTPSATVYLNGRRWYGVTKLSFHQKFKEQIATGTIEGRNPPTTPAIGMAVRWTWGYNGQEVSGFTGEIAGFTDMSYPDRWTLQCNDVLWRADKSSQVLQTSPLNSILASAAVRYLLTHYGGISSSRISIPALSASGAAWVGSEWTLGILTPVQWGDTDTESGGTTALRAAAEICSCLGYWLYADSGGTIRAKQMERKPSASAREIFERAINLLVNGAPERQQSYDNVYNQTTVRGANTGVDGAQLYDQYRTAHPLLPSGVYRDFGFSSFLLEYENAADAGAACVTEVAKRILNVVSRIPDVVPLRAKADPNRKVGDTVGIIDTGIRLTTQRNFFIYQIDRTLDLTAGAFDDALLLDGGTGNTGYTTVPPPDASFSWTLMAETLDGDAVIEVLLDGSGATSPTGEIVSWAWSTSTTTYGGTPNSASGVHAMFVFLLSDSPATITLTVTDTTSKIDTFESVIDLTGADTSAPLSEVVSLAAGSAWYVTPDGGATWNTEVDTTIAVGTIGAGYDDRAVGTAPTYGLVASSLKGTLDALSTASTALVSAGGTITSNIWVNEGNPARIWWAVGSAVYRSTDGGVSKTAMHAAASTVHWIMEDAALDNSVFLLAGANMYNATDPTVGYALLYSGPVGSTARQFVRSRDGQVTWICYTGAPSGEALQRVETGALADLATTDIQTLALDRSATNLAATLYAITADDPAQLWSFDGITGLDAAQSTQFFPSGATVQHMLSSHAFDVIYTADFNSIALNQGAARKYFPLMDQLLLWKALASGEQGHMLGFGGSVAVRGLEIVILPSLETGAADNLFCYRSGAWVSVTPPQAGWMWISLSVNPFNPDQWLLLGNAAGDIHMDVSSSNVVGAGTTDPVLYYSADRGATWAGVTLAHPYSSSYTAAGSSVANANVVEWLDTGGWALIMGSDNIPAQSNRTWIYLGTAGAVTSAGAISSGIYAFGFQVSGSSGDSAIVSQFPNGERTLRYYPGASTTITTVGVDHPTGSFGGGDRLGAVGSRVAAWTDGSNVWVTSDYQSVDISAASMGIYAGTRLSASLDTWYLAGRIGIVAITALESSPSIAIVYATGELVDAVRVDRQTRTTVGCRVRTTGEIAIYDGTAWRRIPGPSSAGSTTDTLEVIVRS